MAEPDMSISVTEVEEERVVDMTPVRISNLLETRLQQAEPASPRTETFRKDVAQSKVDWPTIDQTWREMAERRLARKTKRALSWNAIDPTIIKFGSILNEILNAKKHVRDKDADLQLAGEIGHALLEKNQRVEEVCVELQTTIRRKDEEIRRLEKLTGNYKQHCAELTRTNTDLVNLAENMDQKEEEEEDFEAFSLHDFLQLEIGEGVVDEEGKFRGFTGDPDADMITFRRKLRRERRAAKLATGLYEESMSTAMEEKEELLQQLKQAQQRAEESTELRSTNESLRKQLEELSDQLRAQHVDRLALVTRKREADKLLAEAEERHQDELRRQQATADARNKRLHDQLAALRLELQQLRESRLQGAPNEELQQLQKRNFELESKVRLLDESNHQLQGELDRVNDTLKRFRDMAMLLRGQNEQEKKRAELAHRKNQELMKQVSDFESKITSLDVKVEAAEDRKAAIADQQDSGEERAQLESTLEELKREKDTMQVKLMILKRKDQTRQQELKQKEEELQAANGRIVQLDQQRTELEQKYTVVENTHEKAKYAQAHETISKITQQLQVLMEEYAKKKQETAKLQREIANLRSAMSSVDSLKSAKTKYKEMGKKMLAAMKQMDAEMKQLVAKLDQTQKDLKSAHKENRRLQRKNEELSKEMEMSEQQMDKLMRICITGNIGS